MIELNKKVANLETSKKLKEAGFPQETEFWWRRTLKCDSNETCWYIAYHRDGGLSLEAIAAPLACEVLEQLPTILENDYELSIFVKHTKVPGKDWMKEYIACYSKHLKREDWLDDWTKNVNLATALADLWLWAKKEGYVK